MNTGQTNDKDKGKAKFYFVMAFIFLFILSIVWSIDVSLVYTLSGAAAYCFFFAFKNSRSANRNTDNTRQGHAMKVSEEEEIDLSEELRNIFNDRVKEREANPDSRPHYPPGQRRVGLIIGMVFIFFFLILLVSILSGDDGSAEFYFSQAETFYGNQQYDSAARYYKKALDINADYAEALTGYGNVLMMGNAYDSAIVLYNDALTTDPDYGPAKYQKAVVLATQKKYDESILELRSLVRINASDFDSRQLMGDNFYNKDQYDSALYWYDDVYGHAPHNFYLCYLMGYIYQAKGKTNKAIDLYKEALQYDSSVVDIYERLGGLIAGNEGNWFQRKAVQIKTVN